MAKAKAFSYKQILGSIEKKEFFPIYLFHGEESFYIDELTKYIEENILDTAAKAFNQTVLYGKEIDYKTILDSAKRYPVMSDKQVVVVKEAQELKTLEKLEAYFQNPLESTILVLAHKHKKLDARKKYSKILMESNQVCVFESPRLYDKDIPNWINNYLKDRKIEIKPAATTLLAEYLGTDLSKISNELDKLMLNLPQGTAIDKNIIQKNIGISKDFNVFELQNALGRRDKLKSFLIVKYFIGNPQSHPLPVVTATLYNFFSKVYVCQSMLRSGDQEIATAIGVNKFFIGDYKQAAQLYNRSQLENVIATLKEYDLRSKGVHNVNTAHGELLKEMILRILG